MYRYFSDNDFKTANPPCSIEDMDSNLLEMLDVARYFSGMPFLITSAYRTKEHELEMGRDGTSSHCKGLAVDIKATTSRERYLVLKGLYKAGFERMSVYYDKGFIHADIDEDKPQEILF
jgi:uncharacterized protein YcbK (DUF882 family)